jgi:NAD(P)-dependent dehydrogenase (short-subunit alcohol dehydrogenase family)
MTSKVALIAGAGGVLGDALVREFSGAEYAVATLRRGNHNTPPGSSTRYALSCDLGDAAAAEGAVEQVVSRFGEIEVLVHNAAHFVMAPFAELQAMDFETAWKVSVGGAAACVRAALPGMLRRGRGTLIFSGATGSTRGTARFAAFASAKFALRGLAQSLAREYQPQGIHVAHVVLDGLLRGSPSVARFGASNELALDPGDVAATYRWLAEQPASAWTHEIDPRPRGERF